jgi:predicted RND superfamily exporter protein
MDNSTRTRWFTALSRLTLHRPGLVVAISAVVVIGFASMIPGLEVTTSRYSLVSSDNPYQARLFTFFERFGMPDTPILVLTGGSDAERRRLVDMLDVELDKEPAFHGRVLARIDPDKVAEILLLYQPEALTSLRPFLEPNQELADVIEGGLPSMTWVMARQIQAIVAAEQLSMLSFALGATTGASDAAIQWLGALARAMDAAVTNKPAWPDIQEPAGTTLLPPDQGIDGRGYLVGRSDSNHHMVAIFAKMPGDEVTVLRPIVERIRAIRDQVLAESGIEGVAIQLTGLPALSVDEHSVIVRGLWQSSLAAAIAILTLFLLIFRSVRQTIVALLPLLLGVVMTMATARVLFGELNLITSACVAILLGLGIDFAVHATARYNEALRRGDRPDDAVHHTLVFAGPAILTGAATTAVAFLTTTLTEFTAFSELGVLTALGLLYTLLATFLVLPPLLVWGTRKQMPVTPELPGMATVVTVSRKIPQVTLAVAIVVAILGIVALPRISFNVRYFDFLPSQTESAQALNLLEADGIMGPTFAFLSAESVEEARTMTAELRTLPTVAAVQSATDLMPPLSEEALGYLRASLASSRPPDFDIAANAPTSAAALLAPINEVIFAVGQMAGLRQLTGRPIEQVNDTLAALRTLRDDLQALPNDGRAELAPVRRTTALILERAWTTATQVAERGGWRPTDLPELFETRFASKDGKALAIFVYPSVNPWDREEAQLFRADIETVDANASGTAINLHEHSRMVLAGFRNAAMIAAVLIFLILLLDFRSLRDTLLALAPLACGWLWMLGVMGGARIPFDFANIVALPLVPGIGVAAGVHLMHRCRQSAAENGGVGRIEDLLRGTGAAVFVAAVTTVFGFAGLMVADYGGMISLGMIMSLGIGSCLVGSLVVLPAILLLLGRVR